jgi:hypothetical protein
MTGPNAAGAHSGSCNRMCGPLPFPFFAHQGKIFNLFGGLMLLQRGDIIYQGPAT